MIELIKQIAAGGSLEPGSLGIDIMIIVIAYFVGNILTATIIGRAHGIDIKKEGSGNAGTTNAARVMGKKAGIMTLVADVLKGVVIVIIARLVGGDLLAMAVCIPVLIGHIWPVVFKFQGGKGVAVAFGALVALDWRVGLLCLAAVLVGVLVTRKMSVGSIVGCIALPLLTWAFEPAFLPDAIIMAVLVLFKHRGNIMRLAHGEEPKISFGHKGEKK